jgi:hypothetical protein
MSFSRPRAFLVCSIRAIGLSFSAACVGLKKVPAGEVLEGIFCALQRPAADHSVSEVLPSAAQGPQRGLEEPGESRFYRIAERNNV